jgi:hypothetical protein
MDEESHEGRPGFASKAAATRCQERARAARDSIEPGRKPPDHPRRLAEPAEAGDSP